MLALTACGGGDSVVNPVNGTLAGTAAVGNPIAGGTVKVVCAGGSALPGTTTSGVGAWQVTLAGQGLPCAVQVSGGSVNGVANTAAYHSIALALGTVNVTPPTDLLLANLVGSATPATWFSGLTANPTALASIGQAQVDGALAKLRGAMTGLAPLAGVNPVTASFTPAPGNVSDDMLAALQAAMKATGIPYSTPLNSAAAAAFTAPGSALTTALTKAYTETASGTPAISIPAAPAGLTVAASGTTQLNLNWVNVSGAISYNIYRSTSPSVQIVAANKISSGGAPTTAGPFSDSGLTPATAYYYRVTAVKTAGESIGSAEVGASTNAVAATPNVIGFLPVSGTPGTSVTISGTNLDSFTPAPLVKFGGSTATSTLSSGQTIQAVVPAGLAAGNSALTVANGDGSGSISVGTFAVTAAPGAPVGVAAAATSGGLYSAVLPADNAAFLALLNTACANKTVTSDAGMYTHCTQQAMASFASNLTANMYLGGLPHQTGGSVVSGPSSYAPSTAKVNASQGMAGVALNDSCTVSIPEPYISIVLVEVKGARYYPTGINFNFRGTGDDTITITSAGVVNEYTMTNGQGGKIEVHPNLALFGAGQSGAQAAVGSVANGAWSNYFLCK